MTGQSNIQILLHILGEMTTKSWKDEYCSTCVIKIVISEGYEPSIDLHLLGYHSSVIQHYIAVMEATRNITVYILRPK